MKWNPNVVSYYGLHTTGIAGLALSMPYSLGYISVADAESNGVPYANIVNLAGVLVS